MDASQDRIRQSAELVRAGALFGVIYWLFESIRDLIVQGNRSIFSVVFLPSFREFWMRFLVVCILILFGVIAQRLCRIYTRQNDKGKGTPGVREVMILSAGFSLLYWLLESVRDAWVFHKGTVFIRFISPDPMSVWFRLLPILIVILFGIYILGLLKERTTLLSRQASLTKILEERNVEYFKLADNVKAGIFRAGREGTLLEANQAFLDMFGFTNKEELFTVRSLDLFKEDGVCPSPGYTGTPGIVLTHSRYSLLARSR